MSRINLNHWFVSDNRLSISLMSFYVDIKFSDDEKGVTLRVFREVNDFLSFNFQTLEEAIIFTEEYVNKCRHLEEIPLVYEDFKNDTMPKMGR